MPYPLEAIQDHILSIVRLSDQGVSGTDLMASIRGEFPEFAPTDYDSSNLRDFIRRHILEVQPTGRRGMDYVYALVHNGVVSAGPAVDEESERAPVVQGEVWKTFASPNGVFVLSANPETGKLTVSPPGTAPPHGDVNIPALAAERHHEFASTFTDSRSDEAQRQRLRDTLTKPMWWVPFYEVIKKEGLAVEWNTVRRKFITEELRKALEAAGVPTRGLELQIAPPRRPASKASSFVRSAAPSRRSLQQIRSIAATIVQNMSSAELRDLRVRLGDVIDALEA